ncbi:kinase-like protein [Rhizophagus irregularis]|uniref:Kinase-like protein n=1 Tax=Rhizophagus irregularis TaxID=588596 RepID=A0A2N0R506_9GLOM|nr:kinase-like protein [Rhizophagus irregularis]
MSYGNNKLINNALNRSYALIDYNIHNDIHKQYEFRKQILLDDESLTENEKSEAIKIITEIHDLNKLTFNEGTKRICENCNQECLAISYCEYCVRNYLKADFSNWTSGNVIIDNLIQECQMKTINPGLIPEWIPYNNIQNIEYLTKGGFSEIYTAIWINGHFIEWDSERQQLKRIGRQYVILKILENVENANQNWIEEAKSHLNISNKWTDVVQCFGLTQDPSNGNYMLVMNKLNIDLRKYLQQNHNQLTWKERIQIITDITLALQRIHYENAIHRDLHSGNILYDLGNAFYISDLGFCGPADKPLKKYKNLMKQCWDADPSKRPDSYTLKEKMNEINLFYQSKSNESFTQPEQNNNFEIENCTNSSKLFTSKVHQFDNLPEPRNATEDEQEAFHSNKSYDDFHIPNNVDDFNKFSSKKNSTSKISSLFKVAYLKLAAKSYPTYLKEAQKMANTQNDYKIETMQQQTMNHQIKDNDEDDTFNNPNLHSEEQDELELPN